MIREPVGTLEISERLQVARTTVHAWKSRGTMPAPLMTISKVPIWEWDDILRWAQATRRLPYYDAS